MPHVAFAAMSGLRVRESELLEFGMTLPGLAKRATALSGLPSLGLLTLAGMTSDSGWTYSYHDSSSDTLFDEILEQQPDLVAVSALTASINQAYALCDSLRGSNVPTVIGGLHATALPDEAAVHATSVCVGDGESSWPTILADAKLGQLKPIYRATKPFDLAHCPMPAFSALPDRRPQRWTLQTQRGCPWACEFCAASRLLGPPRFKPVDRIAEELSVIKKLSGNTPWVELADDNTFAGRRDAQEILEVLADANIRFFTESDWRIGCQPKVVQRLAEAGCVQLLVGLESLAFRYPGMGRKRAELDQMTGAIATIQDHGIVVNGCFIIGADGETNASLDALAQFIDESPIAEIQLTLQTPFPGTALHRRLAKQGRLLVDRDWSHCTLFDVVHQPDLMSVTELEQGFRRVMRDVFGGTSGKRRSELRREVSRRHPNHHRIKRGHS